MRLIDADRLCADIAENMIDQGALIGAEEVDTKKHAYALAMVYRAPTVEAETVKHGKWIESDEYDEFSGWLYRCSNCNTFVMGNVDNYCPYCGARMDKDE